MRVFDLQCQFNHVFEGWFGSEQDYHQQKQKGLLQCPVCNSQEIHKRLSAPRLNLGATKPAQETQGQADQTNKEAPTAGVAKPANNTSQTAVQKTTDPLPVSEKEMELIQKAILEVARHVIANTEDVGDQFADEVRSIHYGDAPERPIRGHATADEKAQLREEGIEVHEVLIPDAAKGTLQ